MYAARWDAGGPNNGRCRTARGTDTRPLPGTHASSCSSGMQSPHRKDPAAPRCPTGANRRAWPFSSAPQLPVGAALDAQAFTLRNSRARTQRVHTRLHGLSYHLCRRSARAAGPFAAAVYPSGRSTANASPSGPATHSRTTGSGASPPSRALPRSQRSRVSPAGS